MKGCDPFLLPAELPEGCVLCGPDAWVAGLVAAAGTLCGHVRLDGTFELLRALGQREEPSWRPLLLLHGDHLRVGDDPHPLAAWLESLRSLPEVPHAVLLYRQLSAEPLAALFRAGLSDAVGVPISGRGWQDVLARHAAARRRTETGRLVRGEADQTSRRLHDHRRRLQEELARVGEELIQAQERLQSAHRELSDHLAQLSLLYQFGRELSTARNWDLTLRRILEHLAGFVEAQGAALVLRSAPDGAYAPRQTYGVTGDAWDRVLVRLEDGLAGDVASRLVEPGVVSLEGGDGEAGSGGRLLALPLEHQRLRLGYLLLLFAHPENAQERRRGFLPFLQAVQVILAEEVAGAQMLDRIREMGLFNARVLETVGSGIWVIDQSGRTIYCNRAGQELLTGLPAAIEPPLAAVPLLGRGRGGAGGPGRLPFPDGGLRDDQRPELLLDGLLHLDGVEQAALTWLFARGEQPVRCEGKIVRADGEAVPVFVQTSLMTGRGQDERWLVLVAEDLREAKKLEAERIRADRLQGLVEMSAALAHEIRNPLMGLSAQAELLAEQLEPGDRRAGYIEVITGEVERIESTISRLLSFVRPYEPERTEVDLLQLARDSVALASPRAAAQQVTVSLDVRAPGAADWRQLLDNAQIKQVLLNLLLNAIDAAPDGSVVRLRLARDRRLELSDGRRGTSQLRSGTVIEVQDEGPGFPPGDGELIFRPFYTTKSSGTGLGLAICRKIIMAHGGEIRAEREAEGTLFRVLLPDAPVATARQEEAT